jgi:GTPase SAR1 family protein
MSEVQAAPLVSFPRRALRLVLFGMPDAGKSSLLGALAQADECQPHGLKGHLVDPTQGLDKLRHVLYDGTPTRTSAEVMPYPVVLEPLPGGASGSRGGVEAVLFDCDGQVANEFLSRQRSLNGQTGESPLRDAILNADTLILVVDASNSPDVIKRDFAQFARFLRLLEQSRAERTDVGGLPVYLVLTKCDLLAKKGDGLIAWMERIEEHKRVVDRKFQEYLAQHAARESHPFGKIDLHLWATAVKQPALENTPAKPREPYGVAELFRQCLQSAGGYRAHQDQAGRHLGWVVAGLCGLIGLFVLLGLVFLAGRPGVEASTLDAQIRAFRSEVPEKAGQRLAEPFDDRIKKLKAFQADPAFAQVPAADQQFVNDYLEELQTYRQYTKELDDSGVLSPQFIRTDAELNRLLETLNRLPLPEKYAKEWLETKTGRQRKQWQEDAEIMRREVNKAEAQLSSLVKRWRKVQSDPLTAAQRRAKEKLLLTEGDDLPFKEENRDRYLPLSRNLTYGDVLQFDRVGEAFREWRAIRKEQPGNGG